MRQRVVRKALNEEMVPDTGPTVGTAVGGQLPSTPMKVDTGGPPPGESDIGAQLPEFEPASGGPDVKVGDGKVDPIVPTTATTPPDQQYAEDADPDKADDLQGFAKSLDERVGRIEKHLGLEPLVADADGDAESGEVKKSAPRRMGEGLFDDMFWGKG